MMPRRTLKSYVGATVRSTRPIANLVVTMPAGTVFDVEDASIGLRLKSRPCPHCGARMSVSRVRPEWFEILEEPRRP